MSDIAFRVKNDFSGANISRTIRFTDKIFERLNEIAAQKDVSFNLLVLQCCQFALDNYDDNLKD